MFIKIQYMYTNCCELSVSCAVSRANSMHTANSPANFKICVQIYICTYECIFIFISIQYVSIHMYIYECTYVFLYFFIFIYVYV